MQKFTQITVIADNQEPFETQSPSMVSLRIFSVRDSNKGCTSMMLLPFERVGSIRCIYYMYIIYIMYYMLP